MKKIYIRILSSVLALVLVLFLTSCDMFPNIGDQLTCEHDYQLISSTATCEEGGISTYQCSKCGRIMKTTVEGGVHNFVEIGRKEPTCKEDGVLNEVCNDCGFERRTVLPKLPHTFGEWETTIEMDSEHDGLKVRTCSVCGYEEKEAIKRLPDMDLTYINFEINKDGEYTAKTFNELCDIFNAAILYEQETIDVQIDFEVSDFNKMFEDLCNSKDVPFDYQVESSYRTVLFTKTMEMHFTFYNEPSKQTPHTKKYTQKASLNYNQAEGTRAEDFDDFKINLYKETMKVNSGEQLVYALEHRVKPLPKEGSRSETIYNKMKEVLRQIITDDMDDFEKIKAIHDWIIMNVIYDQELAELLYDDASDLKTYEGFYLEGVFNEGYAVCEGISKTLCCLANIEGIPCVRVTGHETRNLNGVGHAWNKIYINGNWYIIDATSDGTIIGGEHEVLSYAYFLITDEDMLEKYTGSEYNDLECTKRYDVFANSSCGLIQLSSKSRIDTIAIINYFDATAGANTTLQFALEYEYEGEASNELKEAFKASLKSHAYIINGNIVMLLN